MPDCIHGMEPAWCSICLKTEEPKPSFDPHGPIIEARFSGGRCPAGNDKIWEGEEIVNTDEGWCHLSCIQT